MGKAKNTSANSGEDLHVAARSGNLTAVQSFLSTNPLSVNSRDKHSRTPLHLAAWSGQIEVVNYLLKHKADVGAAAMDDMGAIHFAAQKGHLEVVRALVSSGVSIKSFTRKGLTPLHYAVQGSHLELVKYLVKRGASLSAKTKAGKTPLDLANSEEIRLFLAECEKSLTKGEDLRVEGKAEDSNPRFSSPEKAEICVDVAVSIHDEEQDDETEKRKYDGDDTEEASMKPKRSRVSLNHLLDTDDTQDEENY